MSSDVMTRANQAEARHRYRPHSSRRSFAAGVTALLALVAAPWAVDSYTIATGSRMLVVGVLAMSVVVLTGLAGLPTLGQAAYFGIGVYTATLLARAGVVVALSQVLIAAAVTAVIASVIGTVVTRARGVTFLMLTLAVGELAHTLAGTWTAVTGGTDGLYNNPEVQPFWGLAPLELDGLVFHYTLALFVILFAVTSMVSRSPYGLALRGIRDNEARMRAAGYPVGRYLLAGYALSAALAGMAGAMWFGLRGYVSPGDLGLDVSVLALLAAVIGGVSSLWGACLGAALVLLARDYLGNVLGEAFVGQGSLLLGLLFILAVYLLPKGVAGIRLRLIPFRTDRERTTRTG